MILYLWVQEFKNIKNTGFNLSSTYDFSFNILSDTDDKITGDLIFKTNEPPRIFDEKIIDIKAIVGANGAGKTTVIEALLECILTTNSNKKFFVICNNYKIYTSFNIKFKNKDELEKENWRVEINELKGTRHSIMSKDFEKSLVVRYCPILNFDNLLNFPDGIEGPWSKYQNSCYVDISNEGILGVSDNSNLRHENDFKKNRLLNYKHSESELILKMFNSDSIVNSLSHFFRYKKSDLLVDFTLDFVYTEKINKELGFENYQDFYRWTHSNNNVSKQIYIELLSFLIITNLHIRGENVLDKDSLFEAIKNLELNEEPHEVLSRYLDKNTMYSEQKDKILSYIKEKIDIINKYYPNNSYVRDLSIASSKNEDILKLISPLLDYDFTFYLFSVSYPGFSGGEKTLITFLSRLLTLVENIKSTKSRYINQILLILDEPDITLHPEWQRVYLSFLNNLLPNFFKEHPKLKNTKFQIILTTHSPLMLSDLPNENILYIGKDKNNKCGVQKVEDKTFAANIHSLYANSFFLKGGKMAMGKHATETIEGIIKQIKRGKLKDPENIELIVNSIGEPLIKNQLRDMLTRLKTKVYVEDIQDIDEKIEKLNELLEKAKQDKGNKN